MASIDWISKVHDVFLSYSHQDTALMQHVRDDLRASEIVVWTDEGIEPGTRDWEIAIEQAIQKTHCVVVILTPNAKHSTGVSKEIRNAKSLRAPIIPALAEGD